MCSAETGPEYGGDVAGASVRDRRAPFSTVMLD